MITFTKSKTVNLDELHHQKRITRKRKRYNGEREMKTFYFWN